MHSVLGLLAVGAAVILAAVVVVRMRAPPPRESLTIAVARSTFGAPVWVAQGQGFFAADGLRVVLRPYPFGKPALEAMLRGEADVATVAETPLMFAALAGSPVRVIANYASSNEHSLVARADRGIARVADLPGHRVGFTFGTTSHYVLDTLRPNLSLDQGFVVLLRSEARWARCSPVRGGWSSCSSASSSGTHASRSRSPSGGVWRRNCSCSPTPTRSPAPPTVAV